MAHYHALSSFVLTCGVSFYPPITSNPFPLHSSPSPPHSSLLLRSLPFQTLSSTQQQSSLPVSTPLLPSLGTSVSSSSSSVAIHPSFKDSQHTTTHLSAQNHPQSAASELNQNILQQNQTSTLQQNKPAKLQQNTPTKLQQNTTSTTELQQNITPPPPPLQHNPATPTKPPPLDATHLPTTCTHPLSTCLTHRTKNDNNNNNNKNNDDNKNNNNDNNNSNGNNPHTPPPLSFFSTLSYQQILMASNDKVAPFPRVFDPPQSSPIPTQVSRHFSFSSPKSTNNHPSITQCSSFTSRLRSTVSDKDNYVSFLYVCLRMCARARESPFLIVRFA